MTARCERDCPRARASQWIGRVDIGIPLRRALKLGTAQDVKSHWFRGNFASPTSRTQPVNVYNLDLRPLCSATLWSMHPTDLCRLSRDFADIQYRAAMSFRNPTCIAADSDHLNGLPVTFAGPFRVLVVYPPRGLSERISELALQVPVFRTRVAANYLDQEGYLTWTAGKVRLCVELDYLMSLMGDDDSPMTHLVVAFVGRDEVAAQAVALDNAFWTEVDECCDELNRDLTLDDPAHYAWLDEYRHRGPAFLYNDDPDCAWDENDLVWVYLERLIHLRSPWC